MMYKNSQDCQNHLEDIEAIDYFFSKQILDELNEKENSLLLHVFIALHYYSRQGHSCMPISAIADKQLWNTTIIATSLE